MIASFFTCQGSFHEGGNFLSEVSWKQPNKRVIGKILNISFFVAVAKFPRLSSMSEELIKTGLEHLEQA